MTLLRKSFQGVFTCNISCLLFCLDWCPGKMLANFVYSYILQITVVLKDHINTELDISGFTVQHLTQQALKSAKFSTAHASCDFQEF